MNVNEALKKRRSIRKFNQIDVEYEKLTEIVDNARLAPQTANIQSFKYAILTGKNAKKMFPCAKFAGYIHEWNPTEDDAPTAFIAILNDTKIRKTETAWCDCGIVMMSVVLNATELGLGSCIVASFDKNEAKKIINAEENFEIMCVIALGYPACEGKVFESNDQIKYYMDENENFFVPKRSLADVVIEL